MNIRQLPFAVLFVAVSVSPVFARKWTDVSGKFSVEADFVVVKEGSVILKKPDGTMTPVPLDKLCAADREFIASKSKPKKPNKEAAVKDELSTTNEEITEKELQGEWEGTLKDGTTFRLLFTEWNGTPFVVVSFLHKDTDRGKAREAAQYSFGDVVQVPFGGDGIGARDAYADFITKLRKRGRGFGIGNTNYRIFAQKNEVWVNEKDGTRAVAKPTRDGALLVSGQFKIGAGGPERKVPETRLERVK